MIHRVLNNNAAVVLDEENREIVVMGSGIAYNKKSGGVIAPEKIDRIFTLSGRNTRHRFQEIIKEIPMEHVLLSERIISQAKAMLGRDINDIIYIVLTDHIAGAIARHKEGIDLSNPLMWDIRQFYPEEYRVGKMALDMIRTECGLELLPDEAGYIAFHFVNAQHGSNDTALAHNMTQLIREITNTVRERLHIEYDPGSPAFFRFVNHLKFFAQRMFRNDRLQDDNGELANIVIGQNREAYQCVLEIAEDIMANYRYDLSDSELTYMTIHIARIAKESK